MKDLAYFIFFLLCFFQYQDARATSRLVIECGWEPSSKWTRKLMDKVGVVWGIAIPKILWMLFMLFTIYIIPVVGVLELGVLSICLIFVALESMRKTAKL